MLVAETRAANEPAIKTLAPPIAWRQVVEPVEPFLEIVAERLAAQVNDFDQALAPYAEYSLTGQGKQLRPVLVALCAKATGQLTEAHVSAAVIVEMVHLATLVHDDVMDEAEIRRGRLTLAANWSNEIAVLFGDCLFAQALKLAASFPTPDICRAVAAATNTVCSGEILQNRQRHNFQFALPEYIRILEMKTAELFALSCDLGAYVNAASISSRATLRQFGLALGTAYQMFDDCVDVFGKEVAAGKSLGMDLAQGKLTLPVLLFCQKASAPEREKLQRLISNWIPGSFAEVRALLGKYETLGEALNIIHQYLKRARSCLDGLPRGRDGLAALTGYLAQQADALATSA